jgi:hypothetical protein
LVFVKNPLHEFNKDARFRITLVLKMEVCAALLATNMVLKREVGTELLFRTIWFGSPNIGKWNVAIAVPSEDTRGTFTQDFLLLGFPSFGCC